MKTFVNYSMTPLFVESCQEDSAKKYLKTLRSLSDLLIKVCRKGLKYLIQTHGKDLICEKICFLMNS